MSASLLTVRDEVEHFDLVVRRADDGRGPRRCTLSDWPLKFRLPMSDPSLIDLTAWNQSSTVWCAGDGPVRCQRTRVGR